MILTGNCHQLIWSKKKILLGCSRLQRSAARAPSFWELFYAAIEVVQKHLRVLWIEKLNFFFTKHVFFRKTDRIHFYRLYFSSTVVGFIGRLYLLY